jgi:hypothetical protein
MAEGKYELGKTHRYRQSGPHRQLEDHRRHRRSAGDCQNPRPSGPAHPRPATLPCAAIRFIPDNLRSRKPVANGSRRAARSEFERAARSGTLRAPPSAAPPKPAEATLGFSSNRKTIDIPPVRRYGSGQKKRWFKIPIQKETAGLVESSQSLEIDVASVHDVKSARFGNQLVEHVDLVPLAMMTTVTRHTSTKGRERQMFHQLSKDQFPCVHQSPLRTDCRQGSKRNGLNSNRDQAKTLLF